MQSYPYNRAKKRPGVFRNAVYSKVICADDDPVVRKGVDEDLRAILKKPSQNNSHHWNHAPRNDSRTTEQFNLQKIKMPGRGLSFLRKRDDMVVRRMPREEDETNLAPKKPPQDSFDLINHFNDFVSATGIERPSKPTQQKQSTSRVRFSAIENAFEIDDLPADKTPESVSGRGLSLLESDARREKQRQKPLRYFATPELVTMPKTLPTEEVIDRTIESMPKLTLRNGHPLTYSSLVTDICRKSLLRMRNKNVEGKSNEDKPADLMNLVNTTIHQAATESSAMLRAMDCPLENTYASESPVAESNKFQLETPLQSHTSLLSHTPSSFHTPTNYSPLFDLSMQKEVDQEQSFGFSLMHNRASEFNFDLSPFLDESQS